LSEQFRNFWKFEQSQHAELRYQMPGNLILIPTLEPTVAETCIDSLTKSMHRASAIAIVVYNSNKEDVDSYISPSVIRVGRNDSELLAEEFAKKAGCSKEFLFGEQWYGRSYGGASNLLLALGCAFKAKRMAKVDDDCVDKSKEWSYNAFNTEENNQLIYFGNYDGSPTNCLHLLHPEVAKELSKFIYSQKEIGERLNPLHFHGTVTKNGNLVFSENAAKTSCYPVLFDKTTKIHARGEIYFWQEKLVEDGFSFVYKENLVLGHFPKEKKIMDWLYSIALGFDLSFVNRIKTSQNRMPTYPERENAIAEFQYWLRKVDLPRESDISILESALANSVRFTDEKFSEYSNSQRAWKQLMQADLTNLVNKVLNS